ncbi:MAG: FUSC family protein [Pedobacter sp.]|nr:MAG: FUSC family protein [Pedobacter sp.]
MLQRPIRNIHDFLLSTYFADGLRISFGVLCPSLIMAQYGMLQYGMTLSLGALCTSVVDTPGPIVHRRNAMLITSVLIVLISIIVGLTNRNIYFMASVLTIASFVFSMFFLYGARAAAIGTSVLLILVLSIDDVRPWDEVLLHAGLILIGSLWYTLLSYFVYRIRPYRLLQQILSDSIHEVSEFLRVKAKFYRSNANYQDNYKELLMLQVIVHEKQDGVREVLFKTREIVRESTPEGRFLLVVFVDMVDLFEQIMSTYYNYDQLHKQFDNVGILKNYEKVILLLADSLEDIAYSLKTGGIPGAGKDLDMKIQSLKDEIQSLEKNQQNVFYNTTGIIALKNIEINIENIHSRIKTIKSYFNTKEKKKIKQTDIDVNKFVTRQNYEVKLFRENLTFKSSIFRHSIRVSIVMLIGYIVAKSLSFEHSYWILLTILVISKPGFTLTKQRNYQRLIGTILGAFLGMGVLVYIQDRNALFAILLFCMIGSYSFQRKNYVISVFFMTPYVLVLFDFLGMGGLSIARERIYDTLIGSGIALLASYSLFPNWEHEKLKEGMQEIIKANLNYFKQVSDLYFEHKEQFTQYKIARKEVFVRTANLASLFQRMFSEPKSKQLYIKELHQFTVLNHLLSSYIASLSQYYRDQDLSLVDFEEYKPIVNNTLYLLEESSNQIQRKNIELTNVPLIRNQNNPEKEEELNEGSLQEQFDLIQKVAYDLFKLTEKIKI